MTPSGIVAASYQLAQCVLKIGFGLAKKVGWVAEHIQGMLCMWRLPRLTVKWSTLAAPHLTLVAITSLVEHHLWYCTQFLVRSSIWWSEISNH